MFTHLFIRSTNRRRMAASVAAIALAASGLLVPAPSDAAISLAQQDEPPDLWTGDWLLEGQVDENLGGVADNNGAFVEFGVITLQKVTGEAAEDAISENNRTGGGHFTGSCLRDVRDGDIEGDVYRGSYAFGTGGRLWGCAQAFHGQEVTFPCPVCDGTSIDIHYYGSDQGHGEIDVDWKDGDPPTFSGEYGPPNFDFGRQYDPYLEIKGTKVGPGPRTCSNPEWDEIYFDPEAPPDDENCVYVSYSFLAGNNRTTGRINGDRGGILSGIEKLTPLLRPTPQRKTQEVYLTRHPRNSRQRIYTLRVLYGFHYREVEDGGDAVRFLKLRVKIKKSNDKKCRRGKGEIQLADGVMIAEGSPDEFDRVALRLCGIKWRFQGRHSVRIVPMGPEAG